MRVIVIIFGGVDTAVLNSGNYKNLTQTECGGIEVDNLWRGEDVATQITSQFITGEDWRQSGITGRKRYTIDRIEWFEKQIVRQFLRGSKILEYVERQSRPFREGLYHSLGFWYGKRNYLREDIKTPTLFDRVENSEAVYVPAWNPEPDWAIRRNVFSPDRFPSLGIEAAVDLAEKNLHWRKRQFSEVIEHCPQLLITQFQYLDSMQHLYAPDGKFADNSRILDSYDRIDTIAGEIRSAAVRHEYDRILFISDNGLPRGDTGRTGPTHHNRPFYSINSNVDIEARNMRDFYYHVLQWIKMEPSPGSVIPTSGSQAD